jgi:hypothetical protein
MTAMSRLQYWARDCVGPDLIGLQSGQAIKSETLRHLGKHQVIDQFGSPRPDHELWRNGVHAGPQNDCTVHMNTKRKSHSNAAYTKFHPRWPHHQPPKTHKLLAENRCRRPRPSLTPRARLIEGQETSTCSIALELPTTR